MQNNQGVGAGWCDTTSDGVLQNFFALGGFTQVLFCGLLQLDTVADVGDTGFLQATDFVRQLASSQVQALFGVGQFIQTCGDVGFNSGEDAFQ